MVSEGFTKLHPQFASGTTGSTSSLTQNVFLQIRKLPRLALDPNLTGKLLYGEDYNHELECAKLDAALADRVKGPSSQQTNAMDYSDCVIVIRRGDLR